MTIHRITAHKRKLLHGFSLTKKHKLSIGYFFLLLLPFCGTRMLNMDPKTAYANILTLLNMLAMMAFFIQFPLASRLKNLALFSHIDWSVDRHKKIGKWLGIVFLLHPVLILAPRFLISFDDGMISLVDVITAPQMLTGLVAWVLLILWVLLSVYKNKLPISYERWRLMHLVGFIGIAIFATLHITSVGSHGQFQSNFNFLWWLLCCSSLLMVIYNYLFKPSKLKKSPFILIEIAKVSRSDWKITVEKQPGSDFYFEAGQFVWLNTSGSVHSLEEHPFSIASSQSDLPNVSFVVRELGDYTSHLSTLQLGQKVYIDGPYGSMNINETNKVKGITLIAGGAGLGPMLSLLRGFSAKNEQRPIRLIYGNRTFDQMALLDDIKDLKAQMSNFKLILVCQEKLINENVYKGVIDKRCIELSVNPDQVNQWGFYLCGPKAMIQAVTENLYSLNAQKSNIHYEQLSF